MAWLSILILLLLLIGSAIYIVALKKHNSEQEQLIALLKNEMDKHETLSSQMVAQLKADNLALQDELDEYRRRFVAQYHMHFSKIEKNLSPEKVVEGFTAFLHEVVLEITGKGGALKKFEKRINSDMDNIVAKIREDFSGFSEDDIRFICLLIVGFKNCTIVSLMNLSKGQVRTKKCRILNRIRAYKGPHELLYSLFFKKDVQ